MTGRQVLVVLALELLLNELLGLNRWLARWLIAWAARRWEARTGIDHRTEWFDDLAALPTDLARLLSALWIAVGTVVPADRLTLNLPSIRRAIRPGRQAAAAAVRVLLRLSRAWVVAAMSQRGSYRWTVRIAVALLPRTARARYAEEWDAELNHIGSSAERRRFALSLLGVAPYLAVALRVHRLR